MDLSILNDFICIAAVVAAWVVAQIIKTITDSEKVRRFIPLICALVGVVIMLAVDIPLGEFSVYTIIIGAVSGWAATGVYESVVQFTRQPKISQED